MQIWRVVGEKLVKKLLAQSIDSIFSEPKIFPCLHTFCKKCLQGAWKESVTSTHPKASTSRYISYSRRDSSTDRAQDTDKQPWFSIKTVEECDKRKDEDRKAITTSVSGVDIKPCRGMQDARQELDSSSDRVDDSRKQSWFSSLKMDDAPRVDECCKDEYQKLDSSPDRIDDSHNQSWFSSSVDEFSLSGQETQDKGQEACQKPITTSVPQVGRKTCSETKSATKKEKEKQNASTYKSICKVMECPLCLGKFMMTSATIDALPTNTGALQLVELVTMYEQLDKKAPPSCQLCESDSKAISLCLQCNVFLCTACEFSHKRLKLTSTHQINCLEDIKSGKVNLNSILDHKQELCSVHSDKYLELFCKDENCFICLGCAVVKHRNHQYDFISQVVEEQQEEIKSMFPSIEVNIEQLEQARTKVQVMQEAIQNKRKDNVKKIEETFSKINKTLMRQKQELLDEVNRISEERINSLRAQQKQLDTLCQQIKDFLHTAKATVMSGRNQTVLDMKNPIMDRNKGLIAEKDQTELKPSQSISPDVKFHTLDSILGSVNQMGTIPCAERCLAYKTAYKDYCEFKFTLSDPMGKPISGCAALINVFSTKSKSISNYEDFVEDTSSVPLKVYDVGNGEYASFNMYNPYCSNCHKVINQINLRSDMQYSYRKPKSTQSYIQPFSTSYIYCNHCGCNRYAVWNQYVYVFVNKKQISDSPFKLKVRGQSAGDKNLESSKTKEAKLFY